MPSANQVKALIKSFADGDSQQFLSVAMQMAAHEARLGHIRFAQQLRDLVDQAKAKGPVTEFSKNTVPISQPRGELANLLSVQYPETHFSDMVLDDQLRARLQRLLKEQRQGHRLLARGLFPRRKLLLIGPPGSGKTMTASAIAGDLKLPLFTILLEGLITKFLGETAAKLRTVFDFMARMRAVYLFDEFDALGARRSTANDVGEIRRVLNSFLQFVESDTSQSVIIAATNHPELLDKALFRRFDDVINYSLPEPQLIRQLIENRLCNFETKSLQWPSITKAALGLSQADIVRSCDDAAKVSVLDDKVAISTNTLIQNLEDRKQTAAYH